MQNNKLRDKWKTGQCALNGWLSLPCALSAEIMARQGWDVVTIDMQHGMIDYTAMTAMLAAINAANNDLPVLVRVPWLEEGIIMKTLDAGADGIICPMINNRTDAERLAAAVRYPPLGARSFGPVRAQLRFGADYYRHANNAVVALAMIETKDGLAAADDILSVAGVDGVFIGPADLSLSLGCPPSLTPDAAPVVEAIDSIIAATRRQQRRVGMFTGAVDYAVQMRDKGFDMLTVQSDSRLMAAAAKAVVARWREERQTPIDTTLY